MNFPVYCVANTKFQCWYTVCFLEKFNGVFYLAVGDKYLQIFNSPIDFLAVLCYTAYTVVCWLLR